MDASAFSDLLSRCPIIAAAKDEDGLNASLLSPCRVVFALYGTIMDIPDIVGRIYAAGKIPIVHIDLIEGLAARETAADFIRFRTRAAGIISTKGILVKRAKVLGLISIQRFFLLDSLAMTNLKKQVSQNAPDVIEIIPGAMPKIIRLICENAAVPVIAGGLILGREDVKNALMSGAAAISASKPEIWSLAEEFH